MTMDTEIIEIRVPDDLLKQIDERARERGGDRGRLILELIQKGLKRTEPPHAEMTFADLLAYGEGPSPADVMTDDEVAEFAEAEVKAYRAEKRRAAKIG